MAGSCAHAVSITKPRCWVPVSLCADVTAATRLPQQQLVLKQKLGGIVCPLDLQLLGRSSSAEPSAKAGQEFCFSHRDMRTKFSILALRLCRGASSELAPQILVKLEALIYE